MRPVRLVAAVVLATLLLGAGLSATDAQANGPRGRLTFALIGDLPYVPEQEPALDRLIAEINADPRVRFTIHDGDIKSGSSPCTDDVYQREFARMQTFRRALVYTPGDNEWTDCHRTGFDPLERLAYLRDTFFSDPSRSLGQRPLRLDSQGDEYPENARWSAGDVTFATAHVVGSNNNLGRTPEADAEFAARNAANVAWLRETFAEARAEGSRAVLIAEQANPNFELDPADAERTGFNEWLAVLEQETEAFGGPVALVHGDSHYMRVDKPLLDSETGVRIFDFTRIETFGATDVHWLHVEVDPSTDQVFTVTQEIVE